jgi:hypothetical protein
LVTTLQTSETGSVRGLIKVVRQFTSKNHNISLIICFRRGIYYKLEVKAPDNDGKDRLLTVTEIYSILQKIFANTEGINM